LKQSGLKGPKINEKICRPDRDSRLRAVQIILIIHGSYTSADICTWVSLSLNFVKFNEAVTNQKSVDVGINVGGALFYDAVRI
jgi:hypothetical protein